MVRTDRRRFLGVMAGVPAALALSPAVAARTPQRGVLLARQTQPVAETHGINPADMDPTADPRQDFYRYANGGWLDRTTIPADRSAWSGITELHVRTQRQVLGLLENLAAGDALEEDSDEGKAVAFFRQGMDLETRNALGVAPIQPALDEIARITDLDSLHALLVRSVSLGLQHLFGFEVEGDFSDSSVNALWLESATLGLPNRDYYLEASEANDAARQAYIETSARLLTLAGRDADQAEATAAAVFNFERTLAAETLTRDHERDYGLMNNPMSVAELTALYPLMDWRGYLNANGMETVDRVIVLDLGYTTALDAIVRQTPIAVIRDYLALRLLWDTSAVLSEEIEATAFALHRVLYGMDELQPLDERVFSQIGGDAGMRDAVGRLYVAAYFPADAKSRISELVDALIAAFGERVERVEWLTDTTKARAREKLDTLRVKVGYPDRWESYGDVAIGASYAETSLSAYVAERRRVYAQAGKPVDQTAWGMGAHEVNAYYHPVHNEIVFPAAILQPPFFDANADPASNFGGIGYVIGHEITHGFDRTGSQFDAAGNLVNWWADEDRAAFDELNQRVIDQYDGVEVLPGVFVNGAVTRGENVADLGGLQTAWDALGQHLREHGHDVAEVLDGPVSAAAPEAAPVASPVAAYATPEPVAAVATPVAAAEAASLSQAERFFIAAATIWRIKVRDEALAAQVQEDEHAPGQVRATLPNRNMDAFHETFGTRPGDTMYLAPKERIVVW